MWQRWGELLAAEERGDNEVNEVEKKKRELNEMGELEFTTKDEAFSHIEIYCNEEGKSCRKAQRKINESGKAVRACGGGLMSIYCECCVAASGIATPDNCTFVVIVRLYGTTAESRKADGDKSKHRWMVDVRNSNLCHLAECSSNPAFRSVQAFQKVVGSTALKMKMDGLRYNDLINALPRFSPSKRAEDTRNDGKTKYSDSKRISRANKKRNHHFLQEVINAQQQRIDGSDYNVLHNVLELFCDANEGSIFDFETHQGPDDKLRFKRCFLLCGAFAEVTVKCKMRINFIDCGKLLLICMYDCLYARIYNCDEFIHSMSVLVS